MASITAANAVITLAISSIFPTPVTLQGFATDDVFTTGSLKSAEVLMGVDGKLSGGFVFVEVPQEITFQADSPSIDVFDQWWSQMQATLSSFTATGTLQLDTGKKWTMTKGFLTGYKPTPDGKKLAQPQKFEITWESIIVSPS